jgi:hypothetical protein
MDILSTQARLIRLASEEELEECGNEAYMQARGTIELLKEELTSCKTKIATLTCVTFIEYTYILPAHQGAHPYIEGGRRNWHRNPGSTDSG